MKAGIAAALLCLGVAATPARADGLVDNVDGVTLDDTGAVRRFTGLLITPEGRVAKLLDQGDKRPEKLDFRLDAQGRHLIPGLIDVHGHVMALGFAALRLQLADTASLADAQARLAAYAADHPTPLWVQGGGWSQERWGLERAPVAADLDQVVQDRPVVLARADGHALWANSAAIAAAGITAATKDPPGGRILRDARGNPTGIFIDAAQALLTKAVPPPQPVEMDRALARAQEILLSNGLTAIADMDTSVADWLVMRRAGDAGRLDVRILCYGAGVETALAVAGTAPTPWLYDGRLKMPGVRLDASGPSLGRDAQLKNWMSRAAMDGFQVAVHVSGVAAHAEVLDAIDQLAQTYKGDRRWRIEQAEDVDPPDPKHPDIVALQEGILWPDASPESPDPFASLAPQEGETIAQALAGLTTKAAHATFAEDRLGSLEPGHMADFLLVDRDVLSTPAGTRVLETWIGGRRAWVRK